MGPCIPSIVLPNSLVPYLGGSNPLPFNGCTTEVRSICLDPTYSRPYDCPRRSKQGHNRARWYPHLKVQGTCNLVSTLLISCSFEPLVTRTRPPHVYSTRRPSLLKISKENYAWRKRESAGLGLMPWIQ